jgi:hypothetical protein
VHLSICKNGNILFPLYFPSAPADTHAKLFGFHEGAALMSLARVSTGIIAFALISACVDSSQSGLNDLAAGQKAEGFLVVKDIVADKAVSGSFLVTCVGSGGKTTQEVKTKAEVEKNQVCRATAASSGSGGDTDSAPDGQGGAVPVGKFKLSLRTSVTTETYLKAKQNLDITANKAAYQEGLDYCVATATFLVNDLCRVSQTEFKAVGHDITGCLIAPGYLFSAHFSVTPTSVPNCK